MDEEEEEGRSRGKEKEKAPPLEGRRSKSVHVGWLRVVGRSSWRLLAVGGVSFPSLPLLALARYNVQASQLSDTSHYSLFAHTNNRAKRNMESKKSRQPSEKKGHRQGTQSDVPYLTYPNVA